MLLDNTKLAPPDYSKLAPISTGEYALLLRHETIDESIEQRIAQRAAARRDKALRRAKEQLGERYVFHPANRVQRLPQRAPALGFRAYTS